MKAKVIIENKQTKIILTPENDFEIDVIDKVRNKKEKHDIHTMFGADYSFGGYNKQRIELTIVELTNP